MQSVQSRGCSHHMVVKAGTPKQQECSTHLQSRAVSAVCTMSDWETMGECAALAGSGSGIQAQEEHSHLKRVEPSQQPCKESDNASHHRRSSKARRNRGKCQAKRMIHAQVGQSQQRRKIPEAACHHWHSSKDCRGCSC